MKAYITTLRKDTFRQNVKRLNNKETKCMQITRKGCMQNFLYLFNSVDSQLFSLFCFWLFFVADITLNMMNHSVPFMHINFFLKLSIVNYQVQKRVILAYDSRRFCLNPWRGRLKYIFWNVTSYFVWHWKLIQLQRWNIIRFKNTKI